VAKLEDVCPSYVGARTIVLALADPFAPVLAQRPVALTVKLVDEALVSGLVLPLEMRVLSPSAVNTKVHTFTRLVPSRIAFTPREGGDHLVVLREAAHNRWCGQLVVAVVGRPLDL